MPDTPGKLPGFVHWTSFPFEGQLRVKNLEPAVQIEPPREDEDASTCRSCAAPDDEYIWVSERWRVRATDRPTGLPMVLILECRSHLDLGDLPNLLAAELGVMTVRLERAIRSLDGVARVHVNQWGDGSAHLHLWFFARPYGRLQLRGSFISAWSDILPPVDETTWRENLALTAAWLADFGGRALAEPPRIEWQAPATLDPDIAFSTFDAPPAGDTPGNPAPQDPAPPSEATPSAVEPASSEAVVPGDSTTGRPPVAPATPDAAMGGPVSPAVPEGVALPSIAAPAAGDAVATSLSGPAPDRAVGSARIPTQASLRHSTPNRIPDQDPIPGTPAVGTPAGPESPTGPDHPTRPPQQTPTRTAHTG